MRFVHWIMLTVALLMTACAPATVAQPAAETPVEAPESSTTIPPLEDTQTLTDEVSAEVSSETVEESESPASTAITSTDTATSADAGATNTTSPSESTTSTNSTGADTAAASTMSATGSAALSAASPMSAPPSSSGPAYENLMSPVDLLASYYNAVNRKEYERAYSYWGAPPNDYESFAAGYADTASVQLIVQPPTNISPAAGSLYSAVPTVLIAHHHDGSVHTFAGCIVTRKSNLQPPDIPEEDVWHLYSAEIAEVANNSHIPTLLAQACEL